MLGGWYRHRARVAARRDRTSVIDALPGLQAAATAKGVRPAGDWGRGLRESGNGHVVAGWGSLSPDLKIVREGGEG